MKPIILTANGFANNGKVSGTPGLVEAIVNAVNSEQVRVGYIVEAADGLTSKRRRHIPITLRRMREADFEVTRLELRCKQWEVIRQEISNFNVIYLEGGFPRRLIPHLINSGIAEHRDFVREHCVLVGASAGAMALGGNCALSTVPPSNWFASFIYDAGQPWEGIKLIDAAIVPHLSRLPKVVQSFLETGFAEPLLFIPDGTFQVFP